MQRRLIVDGQLFQTPAWHRGMGKYSLELLVGILKLDESKRWDRIEIILSDNLQTGSDTMAVLRGRIGDVTIAQLDLQTNTTSNEKIIKHNRTTIDDYIESTADGDMTTDFLILSLMQGEICPVFPSCRDVTKALIFYDLIPLMFHDIYLQNPITRIEYISKLAELFRADVYLAISKTVANDLSLYLGIEKQRIVSIDGGPIEHSNVKKQVAVQKPFILMPTGNDLRKNNRRAIIAFESFNKKNNNRYKLVITSFFKDFEIDELQRLSSNLVFTSNVSGEELSYLYDHSVALLFPPEYEGLGLPILEAMEWGKTIICSDISVFREISQTEFEYFNPYSVQEIELALEKAIGKKTVNKKAYSKILSRYTWENTATETAHAIRNTASSVGSERPLKLAIFGPNPATNNRAGRGMLENHAELARNFTLEYYIDLNNSKLEPRISYLPYITKTRPLAHGLSFELTGYDEAVYHLSDDEGSRNILPVALAVPGIVVLYDLQLDTLWKAAAKNHLIDVTRMELEHLVGAECNESPASRLVSLVANQKAFVVFTEPAKALITKLANEVNPTLVIELVATPTSMLVYDAVLPKRTISIRQASETPVCGGFGGHTDFRDNEDLSRTRTIVASSDKDLQAVLRAMVLGVVPIAGENATDSMLALTRRAKQSSAATLEAVQSHNQAQFAKAITRVISKVQESNNA